MRQLLEFFRYVAQHPDVYLEDALNRPEFKGVYWYFSEYRGKKVNFCPTCYEKKPLTKHHVIPKKNGGKGLKENYFYVCRECHDEVHFMESKFQKIHRYMKEYPNSTPEELMKKFNAKKETVVMVRYPEYGIKCRLKYEMRISRKLKAAMKLFDD
jgi:hypothetical protein